MRLDHAVQVTEEDIRKVKFDLIIVASGYEARATTMLERLRDGISESNLIVFQFNDLNLYYNSKNTAYFSKRTSQIFEASENSRQIIISKIQEFFDKNSKNSINILVDYSCMSKVWIGAIITTLKRIDKNNSLISSVYFSYSQAKFEKALSLNPNYSASLMTDFSSLANPNKKSKLIIGLGQDKNRALGLIEYLHMDYKNCYLFRTDEQSNRQYYNSVRHHNARLIKQVPPANILEYPINDLGFLDSLLSSLILDCLNSGERLILAPLGPKPFSLLSLLMAVKFKKLNVFRTTQLRANDYRPADRIEDETKDLLICKAIFLSNNNLK